MSTLNLETGGGGSTIAGNAVYNLNSHVSFPIYHDDSFTVGIQGGQTGRVVDLGDERDLTKRYGIAPLVESGQAYASLHYEGTSLMILKSYGNGAKSTFQACDEGKPLDDPATPQHASVEFGHVYLLRVVDDSDSPKKDLWAKLFVVDHVPGRYVTIRWSRLNPAFAPTRDRVK